MRRKLAKQYVNGKMLLLCIIVLLSFTPTALCNERNILVLHSYDPEYIYTRVFNNTLKEELDKSGNSVNLFMNISMRRDLILPIIMDCLKSTLYPSIEIAKSIVFSASTTMPCNFY